jgi:KaiC/GvpD/RAD55 family RecA-like ATPase
MVDDKISLGIQGLDEMLYGGINSGDIIGLVGQTGSGKTLMSLQFLHASLKKGNTCFYISSNHQEKELITHSFAYGWDFEPFINNKQLTLKCMEPVEMELRGEEFHLTSKYLDEMPMEVKKAKTDIVIIDPITDFISLCKNEVESRSRLLNLFRIIKDNSSTALIIAESEIDSCSTKSGIIEYAVDGLLILRRIQSANLNDILHVIQITKMRWRKHIREIRQYDFTDHGIEVYSKYNVLIGDSVEIKKK